MRPPPMSGTPSLALIPLAWLALGCGQPEVTRLEEEQSTLRDQVAELRSHVGALRADMIEAGLVDEDKSAPTKGKSKARRKGKGGDDAPRGKAGAFGNPLPSTELSPRIPVKASRSGAPPSLPALTGLDRLDSACGYKFMLPDLQPLSDFPLNNSGFGKAGPVVMRENGKPMTPHAHPPEFEETCSGAYRHAGFAFLFSPSGSVEAANRNTYSLTLADEVPLRRGDDDREMYWVYPGTTLTFQIGAGWNADWGPMHVHLGGRIATAADQPAIVKIAGASQALPVGDRAMAFSVAEQPASPPSGPWTLEISSPKSGPYVLLGTLTVGNEDHALVITAEEAFAARSQR